MLVRSHCAPTVGSIVAKHHITKIDRSPCQTYAPAAHAVLRSIAPLNDDPVNSGSASKRKFFAAACHQYMARIVGLRLRVTNVATQNHLVILPVALPQLSLRSGKTANYLYPIAKQ